MVNYRWCKGKIWLREYTLTPYKTASSWTRNLRVYLVGPSCWVISRKSPVSDLLYVVLKFLISSYIPDSDTKSAQQTRFLYPLRRTWLWSRQTSKGRSGYFKEICLTTGKAFCSGSGLFKCWVAYFAELWWDTPCLVSSVYICRDIPGHNHCVS